MACVLQDAGDGLFNSAPAPLFQVTWVLAPSFFSDIGHSRCNDCNASMCAVLNVVVVATDYGLG